MAKISDPTRLTKEELITEWAVREEELRLQFESLKAAQTQAQFLLHRYERIFSFCPLPLLVIDNRAQAKDINNAARQLLGRSLAARSNHLLNALDETTRLGFTQAMRCFLNDGAAKAQAVSMRFREVAGTHEAMLVALDTQTPPESFLVIITPGGVSDPE
jgi:hypothetical protein